ncbi:glycosylhydrolase-like jelly roll fold domain-containing protein [Metabacillus malikii]|uniref:Alpha-L-rhamnosidase-like protein n=1 Tax=Metabacillus malikii TaxID=1504265 RepID=A0ABT9ZJZ0_9BACI|nr:glycosyl hydrolase [Metabacillus malikii]MDQ0231858.1 hypothetical protein [Metabacillus malikii]
MKQTLKQEFLNPRNEFTPIPFWFWNAALTHEEIRRQIHDFYNKGVNGFVIHPRIGIPEEIVYLSDQFMDFVETAVIEAEKLNMSVILYDEAMYPSGSAKGLVVKENKAYASKGLKMLTYHVEKDLTISVDLADGEHIVSVQAVKQTMKSTIDLTSSQILSSDEIYIQFTCPDEEQWLVLVFVETFSQGTIRGIHIGEDDGERNAPPSADLLNPEAVKTFIRLTHEAYFQRLKDYFGDTIIAMFTDEPDILGRGSLDGLKHWTADFLNEFIQSGNLETDLPALWLEAGEQTAQIRQNHREAVRKRLTETYYKQISDWCIEHGIALTGHPAASDDIGLLEHFHIPGQDVVWRWVGPEEGKSLEGEHSTAGKCSADAARHRGRRRNMNEFLGVCGKESPWALSPGDMKWYIDWLAVRGVNVFVPHAFYYSVSGKIRSHERPPDVGSNNLWWPFYKQFTQYMKRLSWLMTDSVNQTEIAIICEADHLPWITAKVLYENQIEFNYLETELIQAECCVKNGRIHIQDYQYSVIILEENVNVNKEVLDKLLLFQENGGIIVTLSEKEVGVLKGATLIPSPEALIEAIPANKRSGAILKPRSKAIRVSKLMKNDTLFYLFVNEGEERYNGGFLISDAYKVEKWDAWKGEISKVEISSNREQFLVPVNLERRSAIIYSVDTSEISRPVMQAKQQMKASYEIILNDEDWLVTYLGNHYEKRKLQSWVAWDGMDNFSGTVTYEKTFQIECQPITSLVTLSLGEVYEIAHVYLNDIEVGVQMWAPYEIEINSTHFVEGENTLRIEVTNSMANRMDNARLASGLIGPVSILVSDSSN